MPEVHEAAKKVLAELMKPVRLVVQDQSHGKRSDYFLMFKQPDPAQNTSVNANEQVYEVSGL